VLPGLLSGALGTRLVNTSVDISGPNHGDPGFGRVDVLRSLL
jgi:hypothetical protein